MLAGKTLEQIITEWILDEQLTVSKVQDDKSEFHLVIPNVYGLQFGVEITRPKGTPWIIIGMALGLAPEHKQAFSLLNDKEKKQFIFDLQTELLRYGVEFQFLPTVQDHQSISLSYVIYVDEISRPLFMRTIKLVRNVALLVVWTYSNRFSSEIGNQPPSGYG